MIAVPASEYPSTLFHTELAKGSGYIDLAGWGTVIIQGEDSRDYLHRMSTRDFKQFQCSEVRWGGFLNAKGGVCSLGYFVSLTSTTFQYIVPAGQGAFAAQFIEKFHFLEKLSILDSTPDFNYLCLAAPNEEMRAALRIQPATASVQNLEMGCAVRVFRMVRSPDWFIIQVPKDGKAQLIDWLHALGFSQLGAAFFDWYRTSLMIPNAGTEITEKDLVLEAGLDDAIDRGKGCYPGQEVVERIFTYGQVNRKLVLMAVDPETGTSFNQISVPVPLCLPSGPEIGTLISLVEEPGHSRAAFGLALIRRTVLDSLANEKEHFFVKPGFGFRIVDENRMPWTDIPRPKEK